MMSARRPLARPNSRRVANPRPESARQTPRQSSAASSASAAGGAGMTRGLSGRLTILHYTRPQQLLYIGAAPARGRHGRDDETLHPARSLAHREALLAPLGR